jgi:thiol-disulfide isomerase/thioredoxin
MKLKSLILLLLVSSLFMACQTKESANLAVSSNSSDEQKFSYMLGVQFGRQAFRLVPQQMGHELEEDYTFQGALDAALAYNDTTKQIQITDDSLKAVSDRFSNVARERLEKARPDSATIANNPNPRQLRHISDSLLKLLPMEATKPGTGKAVKITESSSDIEKFSYMLGTEFGTQFGTIASQLNTSLSAEIFKVGLMDGARFYRDSSYQLQLPEDSLRAVGRRFSEKGRVLQEEANKKMMEEQEKLKAKVAGLVGDTLPDGTPAKINFTIKMSALNSKIESFAPYAGKPLFVFYYSTTCGHCRNTTPKVEAFAGQHKADGLTTVAITTGGTPKRNIRRFSDEFKIKHMEVLLDEERMFGELYGDGYVPKFYLVYPDGSYKRYASFEDNINEIEADVKALLKK